MPEKSDRSCADILRCIHVVLSVVYTVTCLVTNSIDWVIGLILHPLLEFILANEYQRLCSVATRLTTDPEVTGSVPGERSHLVRQHVLVHAALQGGSMPAVHQAARSERLG